MPPLPPVPPALLADLRRLVPDPRRLLVRPLERIAFASDASCYRLVPLAVVLARGVDEVRGLLGATARHGVPLTFRSGGTSFCGQAVTDGVLVEVRRFWREMSVEAEGRRVRMQPGMIGGDVNRVLARHGRRIGPDPASINSCTVGGIVANNSSGMCCGVEQNAYHTLESITFLLPSGTLVDTAAPGAEERFRAAEPGLAEGLLALRRDLLADRALADRVRRKYRMKNTVGYGLNALLDFERPLDILSHLLVGSEGTLAFIAEVALRTVPALPHRLTALLAFPGLHAACAAIVPFREAGARALELMDWASIVAVTGRPGIPIDAARLVPGSAALLVEFQADSAAELDGFEAAATAAAARLPIEGVARFTRDAGAIAQIWHVREGLYPAVAVPRPSGTTAIIEDVTFPVERLADAATDLRGLLEAHGYHDAIIYGHAKDGNLHFVLNQAFRTPADTARYERMMDAVAELVVGRYDGALKAEHGTGRNVAPFVEAEWGAEAMGLMRRLKALCDPRGLLNPGVILPAHPRAHLDHLKALPEIEVEADRCIECGFCEKVCPSRELTLSPRQRIVVRRELARLRDDPAAGTAYRELAADWRYAGLDTCAGDGLCQTVCPMAIDTGALVKEFRVHAHPRWRRRAAAAAAARWGGAERLARGLLGAGHALERLAGPRAMPGLTAVLRRLLGPEWVPAWLPGTPHPAGRLPAADPPDPDALYWPSCTLRIFGPAGPGALPAPEATLRLAERAGLRLRLPADLGGTCCGTPWHSKGFPEGEAVAAERTLAFLWRHSEEGRLPVVVDGASCTQGLRVSRAALPAEARAQFDRLRILDSVEWLADVVLPRLPAARRVARVAAHPPCATWEMGHVPAVEALARALGEEVVLPAVPTCCGFAGDRGFLRPELTASALAPVAARMAALPPDLCVSANRTCEIGLARSTGRPWVPIAAALEEATRGGEGDDGTTGRREDGKTGRREEG